MDMIDVETAAPALRADPSERQHWLRERRHASLTSRRAARPAVGAHHAETWEDRHWSSRLLHWIGDLTANATVGIAVAALLLAWGLVGAEEHFPAWWQTILYSIAGSVTLLMAFVIQHTQARQTFATQRKLDELIRATEGADDNLIAVEETDDDHLRALGKLNYADHRNAAEQTN